MVTPIAAAAFKIDDQLELGRELHRQIDWPGAFENGALSGYDYISDALAGHSLRNTLPSVSRASTLNVVAPLGT
jgi:hypothetical protein